MSRTIEYPPGTGQQVTLNPEEEAFLRGIYRQQKAGQISASECSAQAMALLDLKVGVGAEMLPSPDAPVFNRAEGQRLKTRGMSLALRAERVQEWRALADEWLAEVEPGVELTADDLVAAIGLPDTGDDQNRNNVLGGWFSAQSKAGRIVWHGRLAVSQRPERHGNQQRIWTRAS